MSLRCSLTAAPAEDVLCSEDVLAVLEFDGPPQPDRANPRRFFTGLRVLDQPPRREVWRTSSRTTAGWDGAVGWAAAERDLFAATIVDVPADRDVESAAYEGWRQLLEVCCAHGFPHVVRGWNHVPHINVGVGDDERYKRFCVGRHRAFEAHGVEARRYPAASAVGHDGNALAIYLLARSEPGRHFENPRQTSAYRYPRRYGPKPPSFARATLTASPPQGTVFVSGTASIVGDRSTNADDVDAQLDVTFGNIEQLLGAVEAGGGLSRPLKPDVLRVYVRDAEDLPRIQRAVGAKFGTSRAIYLRSDICRRELAVEIEGVCQVGVE